MNESVIDVIQVHRRSSEISSTIRFFDEELYMGFANAPAELDSLQLLEQKFAEDMGPDDKVVVYVKLPRGFQIPTPVGNYAPDCAIALQEGTVKHIYFIAETKRSMESIDLRPIEQAKIKCAKKLFNEVSTDDVVYDQVDLYQNLLSVMNAI